MEDLSIVAYDTFMSLFHGNPDAHGIHLYDKKETPKGEKDEGKSFTKEEKVTDNLYRQHLNGEVGLGIIPVDKEGNCSFSVIDIDQYKTEHTGIFEEIYGYNLPIKPFRSKSGGLHLYIFYEETVKAKFAITTMHTFRSILGLSEKTEIFPKQTRVAAGAQGSWINLPYYNSSETKQYMLDSEGNPLDFESAMELCKNNKVHKETLNKWLDTLPIADGPPCLQHIYMKRETSFRNNYLFSMATYLKAKHGDDFVRAVEDANNELKDPVKLDELMATVISSQKKKVYAYKCKEDPIVSICNQALCKTRKYGVSNTEVTELEFGEFVQYRTDQPYYEWEVNGKKLRFFSEEDIINQDRFRRMVFRDVHVMPGKLSDPAWSKILNTALEHIVIKEVEKDQQLSTTGMFMDYMVEFLTKRAPATERRQVAVDRVFYDADLDGYIFKAKNFLEFLVTVKQFRSYGLSELHAKLKELKCESIRYKISDDRSPARAWIMPKTSITSFIEEGVANTSVNFLEELPNEPY